MNTVYSCSAYTATAAACANPGSWHRSCAGCGPWSWRQALPLHQLFRQGRWLLRAQHHVPLITRSQYRVSR